ncbi:MAG: polysaccharide biosynthesis/export family protein [Ferruginibacter sp.]|nr:polysaccharide biosynthesis/export family protein [Ferruginibacter sp.]
MPKIFTAFAIVLFFFSLHACVAPNKLYYFHDKQPGKDTLDIATQVSAQTIQKNDRLNITVSSTDPALTAYLNPFNVQTSTNSSQQANTGYLVNNIGKIEFPLLGSIDVAGLSTSEAAGRIKEKLSFFYKDLFVNVSLRGQVYFMNGRSGTPIPMINERLTIFEAITQSGVQDAFDKKNAVWLVRERNGQRTYTRLDLNSKSIFQSPYFYLQNNDLIYMQPGRFSSFLSPTSPGRNIITITGAILAIFIAIRNF